MNLMGFVLNGVMRGMRVVGNPEGTDGEGKHWAAGEKWRFLSMEVVDPRYGGVYSCQLSDRDPQFGRLYDGKVLKEDYTGHNVKVTVRSLAATERQVKDKETGDVVQTVLQVRIRVTNVRSLGEPKDDD